MKWYLALDVNSNLRFRYKLKVTWKSHFLTGTNVYSYKRPAGLHLAVCMCGGGWGGILLILKPKPFLDCSASSLQGFGKRSTWTQRCIKLKSSRPSHPPPPFSRPRFNPGGHVYEDDVCWMFIITIFVYIFSLPWFDFIHLNVMVRLCHVKRFMRNL